MSEPENAVPAEVGDTPSQNPWLHGAVGFLIAFFVSGLLVAGVMAYGSTLNWVAVLVTATVCGTVNVATKGRLWRWIGRVVGGF